MDKPQITQLQRLQERLAAMGCTNFGITRGDKPCTQEELCADINKSLDDIEQQKYHSIKMNDSRLYMHTQGCISNTSNADCNCGYDEQRIK